MSHRPRGFLISGNWKMNHGPEDARAFFSSLKLPNTPGLRTVIFAPYLTLSAAREATHAGPCAIGAQNAHAELKGAFTGEVSGPMLKSAGLEWVLVGHSERRQYFNETDAVVAAKTRALVGQGFHVMSCLGETRAEREAGQTEAVLERQLKAILTALPVETLTSAIRQGHFQIAYEPVWAIGTGLTATPDQAQAAHAFLREQAARTLPAATAAQLPFLYGGSVTAENAGQLLACPDIDGALVGGASLKAESFQRIVEAAAHLLP